MDWPCSCLTTVVKRTSELLWGVGHKGKCFLTIYQIQGVLVIDGQKAQQLLSVMPRFLKTDLSLNAQV